MKRLLLLICISPLFLSAQDRTLDSLKLILKNVTHDTTRCSILYTLAISTPDEESIIYSEQLLKLATINSAKTGHTPVAKRFYLNCVADAYNLFGNFHDNKGDIPKALEYYHKCLKIQEDIRNKDGIALSLNNIGYIYDNQKEYVKSLDYYYRSLKIRMESGDKEGIAVAYNNIGVVCQKRGDILKALDFFEKSVKLHEEINDQHGISRSSMNLGFIYHKQKRYDKALECYHRSLKIQQAADDRVGMAYSTSYISSSLYESGKINEALDYGLRSLKLAQDLGYPQNIMRASVILKSIYKKQNKPKEALEIYELEIKMRDSINNSETKKASLKKQFQYQYEKQAAADSVKHVEEHKVKNALLATQQAQLKQEKTQRFALYGGLVLVISFLGFVFNRFKVTQKQKLIIEQQKVKVDQAYTQLEEKNKEVLDSIQYAKRIQTALLPGEKYLQRTLDQLNKK